MKISAATNVVSLVGTEEFPVYDATATAKAATIANVGDYFSTRARKGAKVGNSATQSITNNTWTVLTWDTELFDDGGFWASTNATKLIVPTGQAGRYLLQGRVLWAASATASLVACRIKVTGVIEFTSHRANVNHATQLASVDVAMLVDLAELEEVTLEAWQNSGGSRNVRASPDTWLAMTKLAEV